MLRVLKKEKAATAMGLCSGMRSVIDIHVLGIF